MSCTTDCATQAKYYFMSIYHKGRFVKVEKVRNLWYDKSNNIQGAEKMEKLAVIDLGSNSVRMSIFDENGAVLSAFRSSIRLSEGMAEDMILKAQPQLRAVEALQKYKEIMQTKGVSRCCAVATAAVRKAKNGAEFVSLVKDTTGIEIKVIDGKQEAALDSLAVEKCLDCQNGIICDIGGGSTELIGISANTEPSAVSIPYGSRGIYEMFLKGGETAESIQSAQEFANQLLADCGWVSDFKCGTLVGIGGTLRALAKLDLEDFGSEAVENYEISAERMEKIIKSVEKADVSLRKTMAGISDRAEIILGGIVLLKAVLKAAEPSRIAVADVGVREGVFWDIKENKGIL